MILEELLRLATTRGIREATKVLPEAFAAYMQHYVPFEREQAQRQEGTTATGVATKKDILPQFKSELACLRNKLAYRYFACVEFMTTKVKPMQKQKYETLVYKGYSCRSLFGMFYDYFNEGNQQREVVEHLTKDNLKMLVKEYSILLRRNEEDAPSDLEEAYLKLLNYLK